MCLAAGLPAATGFVHDPPVVVVFNPTTRSPARWLRT